MPDIRGTVTASFSPVTCIVIASYGRAVGISKTSVRLTDAALEDRRAVILSSGRSSARSRSRMSQ